MLTTPRYTWSDEEKAAEPEETPSTFMAYRMWRWTPDDGLTGMVAPWKTSFFRATCVHGHVAPYKLSKEWGLGACRCGINAYKLTHPLDLHDMLWATGTEKLLNDKDYIIDCLPVVGIVELGGIVDEYDRGYRAEYGQIQELTVLSKLPVDVSVLEEQYEVPVRCMSHEDWMREWELTYGSDRETSKKVEGSEAGTTSGTFNTLQTQFNATAASIASVYATAPSPCLDPAGAQRLLDNLKADRDRYNALPKWKQWRERLWTSLRLDWRGWASGAAFTIAGLYALIGEPVAAIWIFSGISFGLSQWWHYK
jgi:hypothetical protein